MPEKKKITGKQLAEFFRYFYSPEGWKCQRLGQAFVNYFDLTDNILFFEEDEKVAANLIGEYVR